MSAASRGAVGVLVALVKMYQYTLSPILALLSRCRFEPSCSQYMIGSLRKFGPLRGTYRGLRRILRCGPWHPGGYDPP